MFEDIGKAVWSCLAALWAVTSLSCQFWQVGSDSSDGSVIERIEVRYGADVLPEKNDPPFAAESECGVQSVDDGILNIEDNVSESESGGSRCKFYSRNDPLTRHDDAVMEFRTRVRSVGAPGQSRSVQAGFLDGTKIILLGLSTTSVQFMARHGVEIPETRVFLDTTVFHTYKVVKHSDVAVDIFVDGELKIRISYASLSDYSTSDAPRQGFGAGSSWGTSNSDWDFVNYTIIRRPQPDSSNASDTSDSHPDSLQQNDREPRYLSKGTAKNLRKPRLELLKEIRFQPPEGVSVHMRNIAIGPRSFFLLNSRDTVSEFGRDGRFIRHIGERLRNQLQLGHIFGLAVNPQDNRIYVSESEAIIVFNPDGSFDHRFDMPEDIYPSELGFRHNGDLLLGLRTIDGPWLGILRKDDGFAFLCEERRTWLSSDEEFRGSYMPRFNALSDSLGNVYAVGFVDYEIRKYDSRGVYVGDFKIQQDPSYRPPPDRVDKSLLWSDPDFHNQWLASWTAVTGTAIVRDRFLIATLQSLAPADQRRNVRLHTYDLNGGMAFQQIEWDEQLVANDSRGALYFSSGPDVLRVYAFEPIDSADSPEKSWILNETGEDGIGLSEPRARSVETEATPAPAFSVTSLDGEAFESRSLRGKVVVLNFWFIGCAPCRVEIPSLNKLVDEFDQRDVVFIAFATDNEAPLRSFLEESPFKYEIIPAAHETISKFNVSTYPTHIIIDQNGNVDTVLFGGGENRHEDLQPLIAALIKKSP